MSMIVGADVCDITFGVMVPCVAIQLCTSSYATLCGLHLLRSRVRSDQSAAA
jgi:hypothetical protein